MWRLLALFLVFSALAAHAQMSANQGNETLCTLHVDVEFANKGLPASGVRVEVFQGLLGITPNQVSLTNSSGWVEFENLLPGDYRVEVSGEGIETANSGNIHIENGRIFLSQLIAVHARTKFNAGTGTPTGTVSVRELEVPKSASKELARGDAEMKHKHWKKAADDFKKAVSIYPQYPSAYYNLSVAYYRMEQPDKQRDALKKALVSDDHFVPALVSLAHIQFAEHKLPETRDLLNKAISADPTEVDALALLVRVDFLQGQYQETIADTERVQSLPHQGYATVHYTAAAAYQQLNRIPEMIEQLKMYLKEDPKSPSASYVRQTIAALQNRH
ncbi:MAG: tetratricopeptide repeat protein [Candidatus Acidiferrales bacterium]